MLSLEINHIKATVPSHAELTRREMKHLMHVHTSNSGVTDQIRFLIYVAMVNPQGSFKKRFLNFFYSNTLPTFADLEAYEWEALIDQSQLFGPIRSQAIKTLRIGKARFTLTDCDLPDITFGEWCRLSENLQEVPNASPTDRPILLSEIFSILLQDKSPFIVPLWIQTYLLLYAEGCLINVVDLPQYEAFFKGTTEENAATPEFGWYSIAMDKAKSGPFGTMKELQATKLHLVLMNLTEDRIAYNKQKRHEKLKELQK